MGTYIGGISIRNNYYNFTPLFEYKNGEVIALTDADLSALIPESARGDINFSYSPYSDTDFMQSHFYEDVPVVFDFETSDLELNLDKYGDLNPTGYRIKTREIYNQGRIKEMSDLGYSLVIEEELITGNPYTSNILELGTDGLTDNTKVMIWVKDKNTYLGPYDITYRAIDQNFIISTKPEEHQYLLSGYTYYACKQVSIVTDNLNCIYAKPNEGAVKKYIDLIDDKKLIEAFKQSISNDYLLDGKLDFNDVEAAVELFDKSELMVEDKTIRRNRLQRIKDILSISDDVDDSYKYISEVLGSHFGTLISKFDDKEASDSLINTIIEQNPNILNRIPEYRYAKDRLEELKEEEESLKEKIKEYQAKAQNIQLISTGETVNLSEIEAADKTLADLIKRRDEIQVETEELKKHYTQYYSLDELDTRVKELSKENDYLEIRKSQLTRETGELESKLADVTANVEKKLADMPIDGLVANRLVEASSSWSKKKEQDLLLSISEQFRGVPKRDFSPEEMVQYMFERVNEVRPLYDKNTVTNICTCIFQNFLTVFSGDPGCGKTSICNIIAQALGLLKAGDYVEPKTYRYIPVSVERGWTSKRDFIGYYNPLTKTFDKNNKRVFEALQINDIEGKENNISLPLVILLDEANLSPMEYYWADFMNVCDDLTATSEINIGEDQVLNIQENLHFLATINNDHTTETLSPRLIDRAAVITLPKVSLREMVASQNTGTLIQDNIEVISWSTIKSTYIDPEGRDLNMNPQAKKIYEDVLKPHFRQKQLYVSPRAELSIINYCSVASKLFDRDADSAKRDPSIIALDYAVSQKILPKINGYGEEYCNWLRDLQKKCEDNYLIRSKEIIGDIIFKGTSNMNYYQFFA